MKKKTPAKKYSQPLPPIPLPNPTKIPPLPKQVSHSNNMKFEAGDVSQYGKAKYGIAKMLKEDCLNELGTYLTRHLDFDNPIITYFENGVEKEIEGNHFSIVFRMKKKPMLRGKTEAETLHLNNWKEGDILVGIENGRVDFLKITKIGEERFLSRWLYQGRNKWEEEIGNTTLSCREWRLANLKEVEERLKNGL
jgi:hypothetical protein